MEQEFWQKRLALLWQKAEALKIGLVSWGLHIKTLAVVRHPKKTWFFLVVGLFWWFCLPSALFQKPFSYVLEDKSGQLLGARIARDGQWRFPPSDSLPERYVTSLIAFEDRRFWYHFGIDPIGFLRALRQNLTGGRVVSGGSTLTMQLIRMNEEVTQRNIFVKLREAFLATRLEFRLSKNEILNLYAAHAPFGGNVVGLEAACWRYYGKSPALLSWGEAATLAVLPNSPGLIHPGRNRNALLAKRNRLLKILETQGKINAETCSLAQSEPLPEKPLSLPQFAPHLLNLTAQQFSKQPRFKSTLEASVQQAANLVVLRHLETLSGNGINNAAILIAEVESGRVLAYIGNDPLQNIENQGLVDVIQARRSTGSTLKPFLYAQMLAAGELLPNSLVPDVPMDLEGYHPENYLATYDGLVAAKRALTRSLNIPFVNLLQKFGTARFHHSLKKMGFNSIVHPPDHYGLTLILGGAECTLWELGSAYANLSRVLGHYYPYNGKYDAKDWHPLQIEAQGRNEPSLKILRQNQAPQLNAAATFCTLDALTAVERPDETGNWEAFQTQRRVAWKTGTSLGFRDAWSVGVTPKYMVAVWVGNADGEGRPGLMGIEVAAPLMFDLFSLLPNDGPWFDAPFDEMVQLAVCANSGYRAGPHCDIDSVWAPLAGLKSEACRFCQLLHLDASGSGQVGSDCASLENMIHQPRFVLQPMYAFYYKAKNPSYQAPPPFLEGCLGQEGENETPLQIIYPQAQARLYLPLELDGKPRKAIFRAAHNVESETLSWYIDDQFLGKSVTYHTWEIRAGVGLHKLSVVDTKGNRATVPFTIITK